MATTVWCVSSTAYISHREWNKNEVLSLKVFVNLLLELSYILHCKVCAVSVYVSVYVLVYVSVYVSVYVLVYVSVYV
jgi:hypothetical protein